MGHKKPKTAKRIDNQASKGDDLNRIGALGRILADMLETDLEMAEEGITVPYPAFFDEMRKNHGFVDLRGRPELVAEIAEVSESLEMRSILANLAQAASPIFSVGCDVGTSFLSDVDPHYTAGGYIQIMGASYNDRSPQDYARFAEAIANALDSASLNHEWRVYFVLMPVAFKVDDPCDSSDMTGSLWIWFHAFADSEERAIDSREALLRELRQALTSDHHISLLAAGTQPSAARSAI